MKIIESHIQMQSHHLLQREHSQQETLKTWVGDQRPPVAEARPLGRGGGGDRLTLSETALRHYLHKTAEQAPVADSGEPSALGEDPKVMAMRLILEALTGKRITLASLQAVGQGVGVVGSSPPEESGAGGAPRAGWGLEYDYHETVAEHEEMSLAAVGEVETGDGRHLQVSMELAMSRDFVERQDIQLRAGDAQLVDPLVINFALGQAPGLSEQRLAFDLNRDGVDESIPVLSPGSGLLLLDRNQDGRVTDGSELFGPTAGSGFAELTALDADGNGWLDDNDPMFAKLQVWIQDYAVAAADSLVSLKDLGIGAILLSPQPTNFSLNNAANRPLGQIVESGLFLRENGSAGSLQEVRLAV